MIAVDNSALVNYGLPQAQIDFDPAATLAVATGTLTVTDGSDFGAGDSFNSGNASATDESGNTISGPFAEGEVALSLSGLDTTKPIHVKVTVVTNLGYIGDGSTVLPAGGTAGVVTNWGKNVSGAVINDD